MKIVALLIVLCSTLLQSCFGGSITTKQRRMDIANSYVVECYNGDFTISLTGDPNITLYTVESIHGDMMVGDIGVSQYHYCLALEDRFKPLTKNYRLTFRVVGRTLTAYRVVYNEEKQLTAWIDKCSVWRKYSFEEWLLNPETTVSFKSPDADDFNIDIDALRVVSIDVEEAQFTSYNNTGDSVYTKKWRNGDSLLLYIVDYTFVGMVK